MRWLLKPDHTDLKKMDELDVRNRIVSFVHGSILTVLSTYHFYFMHASCGDPNLLWETNLMNLSMGYFLYDFIAMAYYGLLDATMVLHHMSATLGMLFPLSIGLSSNYCIRGMFITEVSNPAMHARCILKHYGLRYTYAYELMEACFIIAYIFGRVITGPGLVYSALTCPHNHTVTKLGCIGLFAQSLYFTTQMLGILMKRAREIHTRKIHRIKIKWLTPLTDAEMEKLGIDKNKGDKGVNL